MGGNIKTIGFTRRYERREFEEISGLVYSKLIHHFNFAQVIPYFKGKKSFGDLDLIVYNDKFISEEIRAILRKEFSPENISVNDNVFSFAYKELQVDLIVCEPENYESSLNFYSWNDCGMFKSRLIKRLFDLKFGHKGLVMPVRTDNTQIIDEICVSRNTKEIFDLVGFDYNRWKEGFETEDDLFKYLVDYPYLDVEAFKHENLNHLDKKRNVKRVNWNKFIQYLSDHNIQSKPFPPEALDKVMKFLAIKGILSRRDVLIQDALKYKAAKKKLLAAINERFPTLQGKELGVFISNFKSEFLDDKDFAKYINSVSKEYIICELDYDYGNLN